MSKVLDACCGSKMFWFDQNNPITTFQDKRTLDTSLCDGRQLLVKPDVVADFTNMPWPNEMFKVVVLDPPHFDTGGDTGWQVLKYGRLPKGKVAWTDYLERMFSESFRVLDEDGILVFKWNETQIPVSKILSCCKYKPMLGHKRAGKSADTHWILFMKSKEMIK